jgi:hypothetical protein
MAKANRDGVNKSAEVRELLAQDRNMPTKEIISTLGQRGIRVQPHLVYLIRSQARARKRRQRREQVKELGIANPVDLILEVRQLSEKAGGLKHLKKLVDVLAE